MSPDPATATVRVPEVVPARMLNEYAYCPRLAYLEWVQQEWTENRDTTAGSSSSKRGFSLDSFSARSPNCRAFGSVSQHSRRRWGLSE